VASPSTSKSPVETKAISSYFSSPPTSESSTKTDKTQKVKILSNDLNNEEKTQEQVTKITEKDHKPRSEEEKQDQNKPKTPTALRQSLLSPKKTSEPSKKKRTPKTRNKG